MLSMLSENEKNELIKFSENISKEEIIKFFTLKKEDIINSNKYNTEHNRLGFAIQLCVLRYKGWPFSYIRDIPYIIIKYVSAQLKVSPESFALYGGKNKISSAAAIP